MNLKNLNRLLKHLEKQKKTKFAARFNMRYWGDAVSRFGGVKDMLVEPVCKTQACLAGETVLAMKVGYIKKNGGIRLTGRNVDTFYSQAIVQVASDLLGLNDTERASLFYFREWNFSGWPAKYQAQYEKAKTPNGRLAVAIKRLKHFIKTDGQE